MNVTPRLKRILTVMLEQDRVMAVKELAEKVGVSNREERRKRLVLVGSTRKKKIFATTTKNFEYKHKTKAINIEETHII